MNQAIARRCAALLLALLLLLPVASAQSEAPIAPSADAQDKAGAMTSLTLNTRTLTISPRMTFRFKAKVQPANATGRTLTWTLQSQNPPANPLEQCRFDANTGIFTAGTLEGEALTLTVRAAAGRSATARILVKTVPVRTVKFSKPSVSVAVNRTHNLKKYLLVQPIAGADRSVTWASSDESVATVDEAGVVTAREGGTAKITASSTANPEKRASITVKVGYVKVKSIALSAANVTADQGEGYQAKATIKPANASYRQLLWTSSDESVATVSAEGLITAKGPGVATITAKAPKDSAKRTLKFRVRGGGMKVVKLSAVGDVVLGGDKRRVRKADGPIGDGKTSYTRFKALYDRHGADFFFGKVSEILKKDSVTIANIEGSLTEATSHASKTIVLSGLPKYREVLRTGGVDVGSIVNNHSYDFGQRGYSDTAANLRAAGITPVRAGGGGAAVLTVDGVRMGFVSFKTPVNRAQVRRAIRDLKKSGRADVVVASFHWAASPEWTSKVTGMERSIARFAINSGADLVLGHHKHLVSGIERYKGKMIAYDLGNFVSLIRHKTESGGYVTKDSMIYQQRFHVFEDGYVEVAAPNILPVLNCASLTEFNAQPVSVGGSDAGRILEKIRKGSPAGSRNLVRTIDGY